MTLSQIENKMTKLLTKELNIISDEFEIKFFNDGSFNILLFTEENKDQDIKSINSIRQYFLNLGAQIINDVDVYECDEDGYLGTFLHIKK
tara:strand:+ start:65 stop:334 length:270 start_codon:yes stop_codon:yes gene_type:complete